MKYFSEVLNKVYDTQEACVKAEEEHTKKVAEEKAKKEKAANERANRAKEVEIAYAKAIEAKRGYDKVLEEFLRDYGSFHATFKSTDPFFSFFDWF